MLSLKGLITLYLLVLLCLTHVEESAARRGGGGGGGRSGGGRGRSSGSGRWSKGGSSYKNSNRSPGYGVSASSYKSKPKTSLRSYNPYSYSGGRSSSYNGFGLGLGAGMIVGYQLGGLHRPIGYSESSYNYNYIHKDRGYYQETPFTCVKAEAYEYLKLQSDLQEVDIEEGDEICESPTDVCFGRIHITKAEITTANSTEVIIGYEVKIEKGCIGNDTLEKQDESTYDTDRKCFTSSLNESSNTNGNRNGIPTRLIEALGIENDLFMNVTLQSQMETCTCKGWYCNGSSLLVVPSMFLLIAMAAIILG